MTLCAVYDVLCVQFMLYFVCSLCCTLCAVYAVLCVQFMLYFVCILCFTVCAVYAVLCVQFMMYFVHSWAQRKLSPLNILLTINGPLLF